MKPNLAETHISTLFFTDDRVYKLAKKVDLPFLHLVDVDDRLASAQREYEINHRFAPDVYLGLADVIEDGRLADRMVVMRRLPADRRLSNLLHDADTPGRLRDIARHVAAIHAKAPPITGGTTATAEQIAANWSDNFAVLQDHVGPVIDATEFETVQRLATNYIAQCSSLFTSRIRDGFVRDGHGDLIADDIYCLDDGPRLLDCLAFDDDLRIADILNDIAFLAMDVHRLAGPGAAELLMRSYHDFGNEQHPPSLAHHYVAYRAHVRAKIACLRFEQGERSSDELARTYHALALDHLQRAQIRVIMIGGGPGVGKTLVSQRLADHYGYVHLATDEIRHDVALIPHGQHAFARLDEGAYDPQVVDATYAVQRSEAQTLVCGGHGVVLDASWASERHRTALRRAFAVAGADVVEIECVLDDATARARIVRRLAESDDPSDATPDLIDLLRGRRDAWPAATQVSTAAPIDELLDSIIDTIDRLPERNRP